MSRFRFIAKSVVHGVIDWSGRSRHQRRHLRGKLIILTYHSFCKDWPSGLFNSLPVDRFEKQLKFLKKKFSVVSLKKGLEHLRQGDVDGKPWLAITIDDGFRDNYTHAWPLLRRYNVPATIFLATDFIDTGRPPWPTQLVEILERTEARILETPFEADIQNFAKRTVVAQRLKNAWSPLEPLERLETIQAFRKQLGVSEETRYPPLTWSQIHEMRASGIEFGSHTVYHSILPAVDSTVLLQELRESMQRLDTEMQEPCILFAYPDGKHSELSKEALISCGYHAAVTQDFGMNQDAESLFSLKRIEIPFNDPLPSFRSRVSFALKPRLRKT